MSGLQDTMILTVVSSSLAAALIYVALGREKMVSDLFLYVRTF